MSFDDDASNTEMLDREMAIKRARSHPAQTVPLPTTCDNGCGDANLPNSRFCSADCAHEWVHRQRMRKINGN